MPHTDPATRRAYDRAFQRAWHERRKREFFEGKRCADCGTDEDLMLVARDYVGLRRLTGGTNPWSLSRERFAEFVDAYAVVRCRSCSNRHVGTYRRDRRTA